MFEKIEMILRDIEEAREEIAIVLNMANISFLDYIEIKRGDKEIPQTLGAWNLSALDEEVSKLKESISKLNKIKNEVLTF